MENKEEKTTLYTAEGFKALTDELFRYFLVFGRADLEMNLETLDARLLLEQLLGEAEFDLSDAGFAVQRIEFEGECSVTADPMYLKRVLDNLVSNIKKYADRGGRLPRSVKFMALSAAEKFFSVSKGVPPQFGSKVIVSKILSRQVFDLEK